MLVSTKVLKIGMPKGLPFLIHRLAKAVIREQPLDINDFLAQLLEKDLDLENTEDDVIQLLTVKNKSQEHESPHNSSQIKNINECQEQRSSSSPSKSSIETEAKLKSHDEEIAKKLKPPLSIIKEEEEAATKIQAGIRGFLVRKKMKQLSTDESYDECLGNGDVIYAPVLQKFPTASSGTYTDPIQSQEISTSPISFSETEKLQQNETISPEKVEKKPEEPDMSQVEAEILMLEEELKKEKELTMSSPEISQSFNYETGLMPSDANFISEISMTIENEAELGDRENEMKICDMNELSDNLKDENLLASILNEEKLESEKIAEEKNVLEEKSNEKILDDNNLASTIEEVNNTEDELEDKKMQKEDSQASSASIELEKLVSNDNENESKALKNDVNISNEIESIISNDIETTTGTEIDTRKINEAFENSETLSSPSPSIENDPTISSLDKDGESETPVMRRSSKKKRESGTEKYRSGIVLENYKPFEPTTTEKLSSNFEEMDADIDSEVDSLNQAASKIQAGFRGYKVRKGLNNAATKIQSNYRGYKTRKELQKQSDAAVKIQATIRGFLTRKKIYKIKYAQSERRRSSTASISKRRSSAAM